MDTTLSNQKNSETKDLEGYTVNIQNHLDILYDIILNLRMHVLLTLHCIRDLDNVLPAVKLFANVLNHFNEQIYPIQSCLDAIKNTYKCLTNFGVAGDMFTMQLKHSTISSLIKY
eukprot:432230_1